MLIEDLLMFERALWAENFPAALEAGQNNPVFRISIEISDWIIQLLARNRLLSVIQKRDFFAGWHLRQLQKEDAVRFCKNVGMRKAWVPLSPFMPNPELALAFAEALTQGLLPGIIAQIEQVSATMLQSQGRKFMTSATVAKLQRIQRAIRE